MAHVIADRVADTSTTTGTGAFTVSGSAPTGFRTLSTVLANADTFYYVIAHQSANEWEVGLGTHSGGNVFARTTPIASSNGGAATDFSAGTKDVFLSQPAARDNPRLFGLTDNRLIRADGTAGNMQQSGITVDDSDDVTGIGNTQYKAGSGLRSGTTAADTLLLQARDVDGAAWTTAIRLTSGDTPTFELVSLDLDTNGRAIMFDDNTGIKDDSGNELLIFQKTASAITYWEITNNSTGNPPILQALGETNTEGTITANGTGGIRFTSQPYCPQATLTDQATIAWNLTTQPSAIVTLTDNRTLDAPTNQKAGSTYVLVIKQDGTGGRTLTWNAAYKFPGGVDPTLSTGVNDVDVVSFVSDGTNMYGVAALDFS